MMPQVGYQLSSLKKSNRSPALQTELPKNVFASPENIGTKQSQFERVVMDNIFWPKIKVSLTSARIGISETGADVIPKTGVYPHLSEEGNELV